MPVHSRLASFITLACVDAFDSTGTDERMVQPEFVAQSMSLQLGLATIELEYRQRDLLQDDTVFADLAEHIFACENAQKRELNY